MWEHDQICSLRLYLPLVEAEPALCRTLANKPHLRKLQASRTDSLFSPLSKNYEKVGYRNFTCNARILKGEAANLLNLETAQRMCPGEITVLADKAVWIATSHTVMADQVFGKGIFIFGLLQGATGIANAFWLI